MSLFDRFRKKRDSIGQQASQGNAITAIPDTLLVKSGSLREEVIRLYDHGVDPVHTIGAMLCGRDRSLITDAEKLAGIWLGINDLLDKDDVFNPLRSELVGLRDVLGRSITDAGDGPKAFIENYRESTRKINEMKVLQSYKLTDDAGQMRLAAVKDMIADLENERANNPGSLAQDISEEKMTGLYRLVEHWDDPSKLKT